MKNIYQFYPTPKGLANKMVSDYSNIKTVLDPSAGKGDLLDAFSSYKAKKYAIEIDTEFKYKLQTEYEFISSDFLQYTKDRYFDLIIMNPPFNNGVDHLLKAWEITDKYVVCLLNAETILNPYSLKRRRLVKLIEQYGSYELVGKPFAGIDVEVALIRLEKEENTIFNFSSKAEVSKGIDISEVLLPEKADELGRLIDANKGAIESLKMIVKEVLKLRALLNVPEYTVSGLIGGLTTPTKQSYNDTVSSLNSLFWKKVLNLDLLRNNVSEHTLTGLYNYIEVTGKMAFTKENIFEVINFIMLNRGNLKEKLVQDVFEKLTKYYDENREYLDGWKSNSSYQLKSRIVIPYIIHERYDGRLEVEFRKDAELNDIDKAFCTVTGKRFENIKSISKAIEDASNDNKKVAFSTFFKIRFYKKGTIHLYFLDENVRILFNKAVAGKGVPEKTEK